MHIISAADFPLFCSNFARKCLIDRFHSRDQQPCKFIVTKESLYIRKEFNSHRIGFTLRHGRRFIIFALQHGRRDVTWKPSFLPAECSLQKSLFLLEILPAEFIQAYLQLDSAMEAPRFGQPCRGRRFWSRTQARLYDRNNGLEQIARGGPRAILYCHDLHIPRAFYSYMQMPLHSTPRFIPQFR